MVKWFKDIVAILFVVLFFTSLFLNVRFCISNKKLPINDTTRITVFDTIPYYKPVPKDSTVIKYITQVEKPLNFAPFGHAELSLLAKI